MSGFPQNVIDILADQAQLSIVGVEVVFKRPLRAIDPDMSIGISAVDWMPEEMEIGGFGPTLSSYLLRLESFVKHTDEEEGRAAHVELARQVRTMLYRNNGLRVRLAGLQDVSDGVTERLQRWGVRQQRFASNELDGDFLYLSTTEMFIQTETV